MICLKLLWVRWHSHSTDALLSLSITHFLCSWCPSVECVWVYSAACMCQRGSPMVQCSPVQPWWQSHLPSRQTPWSMQRGWQSLCSHSGPVQPSSHWHTPLMHEPWGPQSTTHTSVMKERAMETCSFRSGKKELFFLHTVVFLYSV